MLTQFATVASAALPEEFFAQFGQAGTGAGDITGPTGIATNLTDGHIYVGESTPFAGDDNARISEFTPWGNFVKAWGWGVADGAGELEVCTAHCRQGILGAGPGQFDAANGVAVGPDGSIYVFEHDNLRFQKFSPAGEFLLMAGGGVDQGPVHPGNVCTAAFIAEGDQCGAGVKGTGPGQFDIENVIGVFGNYIAVGPDGTVYVGDRGRIQEFNPDGTFKGSIPLPASGFAGSGAGNPGALALDPTSGDLYFAFNRILEGGISRQPNVYRLTTSGIVADVLDVPFPEALATDQAGNVFAVNGSSGGGEFEVAEFDAGGEALIPVGSKFASPPARDFLQHLELTSLGANSVGDLYVGAGAIDNQESYVEAFGPGPVALEPPPAVAPTIGAQYAVSVGSTGATVRAEINPHFWADTKYFVEYGTADCAFSACLSEPAPPGLTLSAKVVSKQLTTPAVALAGLEPGTTYHYRFVSQSGGGGPVFGGDRTFTTPPLPPAQPACPANQAFRLGAAARLPDCRAYEMVSPVDKEGADIEALFNSADQRAALNQAAQSGEAISYSAYRSFGGAPSAPYSSQYLSGRGSGGWATEPISPLRHGPSLYEVLGLDAQFKAFSSDLCQSWLLQDTDFSLASGSVPGFPNLYQSDNCAGGYQALTTTQPSNVDPRDFFPEIQGFSSNGTKVFFRSRGSLAVGAASGKVQLYEAAAGKLKLVCVRPNGTASKEPCSAGTPSVFDGRSSEISHAVSDNGSTVYWSESEKGPARLFVRVGGNETAVVSAGLAARFWTAAADGSKAIYSEGKSLFEFDLASKSSTLVAAGFEGLLGASDDASRLYLVSTEALAPGGVVGKENLYLHDSTSGFRFIGELDIEDVLGEFAPASAFPSHHPAQVTPDGRSLVFMSRARPGLTGFDNTDANSGEPDAEVYLYDSDASAGAGALRCVSCLVSGARPSGANVKSREEVQEPLWTAGSIPAAETALYAPRVISDDGTRLFFQSFDALSAADVNSTQDVYEWEQLGAGNCAAEAPGFLASVEGCVGLISSGESEQESRLVDSGGTGRDVFIATTSKLVQQDPGLVDIYDARAGGGFAEPPPAPAECEDAACQHPVAPAVDPTPASAVEVGPENPKPLLCPKGKHRVRRNGRPVCVKSRPKKHRKHHKAGHRASGRVRR